MYIIISYPTPNRPMGPIQERDFPRTYLLSFPAHQTLSRFSTGASMSKITSGTPKEIAWSITKSCVRFRLVIVENIPLTSTEKTGLVFSLLWSSQKADERTGELRRGGNFPPFTGDRERLLPYFEEPGRLSGLNEGKSLLTVEFIGRRIGSIPLCQYEESTPKEAKTSLGKSLFANKTNSGERVPSFGGTNNCRTRAVTSSLESTSVSPKAKAYHTRDNLSVVISFMNINTHLFLTTRIPEYRILFNP